VTDEAVSYYIEHSQGEDFERYHTLKGVEYVIFSWPKQLEKKLNLLNNSKKFEVLDFAVGGAGAFEKLEIFRKSALKYNPDMVILQLLNDDCQRPGIEEDAKKLFEEYKKGDYKLPPDEEKLNLSEEAIFKYFYYISMKDHRGKECEKWLLNPISDLINITKDKNITLVVIAWNFNLPLKNRVKQILYEKNILYLDFTDSLPPFPSDLRLSDNHLSEFGYDFVSNETLKILLNHNLIK
jgi:hypothetical protein